MTDFTIIRSEMLRHKARTVFTVLSVTTAFAVFLILAAIKQGMTGQVSFSSAQRLITYNRIANGVALPVNYAEKIASVSGVKAVAYFSGFKGYYQNPTNTVSVLAFSVPSVLEIYPEFKLPPEHVRAFLNDRQGAIIGEKLADRMGWKVGQTIPVQGGPPQKDGSTTWFFHIDGVYGANLPEGYLNFFVVNYKYFNEGIADPQSKDMVVQFNELIADPHDLARVSRSIDAVFANASPQTRTRSDRELALSWIRQFGDVGMIVTFVAIAVFLSMLLITGNTMTNSIRERMGQLALMRAIGFKSSRLLAMVIAESAFLVVTGAVLGITLGWEISQQMAPTVTTILQSFAVTPLAILAALGLAVIFTLCVSIAPSLRVSRLPVAITLREL